MRCALTGHRELPSGFDKNALCDGLEEVIKDGYIEFLCGMAVGFDLLALDCLVYLKQKYEIRLKACIPYNGQESGFGVQEKKMYRELLPMCDEKTVLFDSYRNGCFLMRDRYMVDHADMVYAYCVKKTGGAAYTVAYAKNLEKEVRFFQP